MPSVEAWLFESYMLRILVKSIRDTIHSVNEARPGIPWPLKKVVKSILTNANDTLIQTADLTSEDKVLGLRIIERWLKIKPMGMSRETRPTIFGSYEEGTECVWPGGCIAKSPTEEEKNSA